ncbi:MAG TPA: helix-turn-helix transcriptional regulator [Candidatus Saccharimonadales bacterium]|jgi:transcriptional regulator with XRE-family HTH domain|nr:helix-turn-helix transcriptional regulator [Candidatus Saccharimonadales bacterium]
MEIVSQTPNEQPFTSLGKNLKDIRQSHKQSLAEVSGAVEVDVEYLDKIESGISRPSEDILMLLINHFDIKDDQAGKLWRLAGYDNPADASSGLDEQQRSVIVMMALDTRVTYSDNVEIDINDKGLVLNFTQQSGPGINTSTPIARVGMSYSQANEVMKKLQASLLEAHLQPKHKLLAPKNKAQRSSRSKNSNTK